MPPEYDFNAYRFAQPRLLMFSRSIEASLRMCLILALEDTYKYLTKIASVIRLSTLDKVGLAHWLLPRLSPSGAPVACVRRLLDRRACQPPPLWRRTSSSLW